MITKAEEDLILDRDMLDNMARAYLGDIDRTTPLASPYYADSISLDLGGRSMGIGYLAKLCKVGALRFHPLTIVTNPGGGAS